MRYLAATTPTLRLFDSGTSVPGYARIVIDERPGLRTGQLAKRAGVNIQTLRYYERRGLLPTPIRSPSGQRTYPEQSVNLVLCIKGAQHLGFTLTEIAELLRLAAHHRSTEELRRRAHNKMAEVDGRISALQQIRRNLETVLSSRCEGAARCSCGLGVLPLRRE
jgi:DNA-binding transcriptional MerR regulator